MYNYNRGAQRNSSAPRGFSNKFQGVDMTSLKAIAAAATAGSAAGTCNYISHTDRLLHGLEYIFAKGVAALTEEEFQKYKTFAAFGTIVHHWGGEVQKRSNQEGAERLLRLYRAMPEATELHFLEAWETYKAGGDAVAPVTLSADETAMVQAMAALSPEMAAALEAKLLAGKQIAAGEAAKPAEKKLSGASLLKQRLESLK
jgi:hypothetical protein